ncbi:MAG: hypothetical protein HY870_13800 [Chloroflexi bacterium]|nr:hypothetical protein [Chloroflexota bacterium]
MTEQISLATASSSSQANLQLNVARRRLDEFEALVARDDVRPELLDEALIAMSAALQVAALLPEEQQQWVAETVVRLTDAQAALAANSSATASLATRASLEASVAAASATRERALQLVDVLPPPDSATATAPTATNTSTSTSMPRATPSITPTPSVGTPTDTVLPTSTRPVVKPTDKPTKTPKPPNTPPGLVKTPNTPPGQVKTPKPDTVPPGQEDKTPKPKK